MKQWAAYITLALIYGSVYLFIGIAVDQLNPFEIVFFRAGIAALGLHAILKFNGIPLPKPRVFILTMLLGVVNIAIPFAVVSWAQQTVSGGVTSVLSATNPLMALFIAHWMLPDERITPLKLIGMFTGFAGVVFLISRDLQPDALSSGSLIPEIAIVGTAFCFALSGVLGRILMRRQIKPIVLSTGIVSGAAVFAALTTYIVAPVLFDAHPTPLVVWEPDTILSILTLSIVSTMLSYSLTYFVINQLGVVRASLLVYVSPPISLALGVIFRNELLDMRVIIGAVIILAGVAISNLNYWKPRPVIAAAPASGD